MSGWSRAATSSSRALFEGDHAYILQQPDGRVVFAIAYHDAYTLIGTTDVPVAEPGDAIVSGDEVDYLCAAANRYFARRISRRGRRLELCRRARALRQRRG